MKRKNIAPAAPVERVQIRIDGRHLETFPVAAGLPGSEVIGLVESRLQSNPKTRGLRAAMIVLADRVIANVTLL